MPLDDLPGHSFPRTLRADRRLNITARLAWLMVALAYRSGFASMAPARMADELHATIPAVRRARQKLVVLGLFALGEHWRYERVLRPGEDGKDYWRRVRAERRLDLTTRCAWTLADLTRGGERPLSLHDLGARLGTTEKRAALAVGRVLALGLFSVTTGGGRGRPSRYARLGDAAVAQPFEQQEVSYYERQDEDADEEFDVGEYFRQQFPERRAR